MKKIGLTGGIATGKTTASDFLKQLDVPIIDADVINYELLKPNQLGYKGVLKLFPKTKLNPDLSLDKKHIRKTIFNSETNKQKIEALLHPLIKEEINRQINTLKNKDIPYCIVSVAILIEANFTYLVDEIWVTDCSEETQIKRLTNRDNITKDDAKLIMSNQLDRQKRLSYAKHIINSENIITMQETLHSLHKRQIK